MSNTDVDLSEVRRWARDNGIDVAAKGAIARDVIERFKQATESPAEPAPEEAPAGHADEAGITDELVVTLKSTSDGDEVDAPRDDATPSTDTAYRDAWRYATGFDTDWLATRQLRNTVSVQTLDNGFVHAQRATGTDEVQARLAERGWYDGAAHGQADEATVLAYARFQDSIGLPGTGIPERSSLEALGFDVLE